MTKMTLRAIRINAGETQEDTAKALGINVMTYSNYEAGKSFPTVPMINKILEHFDVSYDNINFLCNNITVKQ